MRSVALGFLLVLCACGSSTGLNPGGGDGGPGGVGGNGAGDMTGGGGSGGGGGIGGSGGSGGGMDASAAYNCNEILSCVAMCGGLANRNCTTMCRSGATQMARQVFGALQFCVRSACYPHPDAAVQVPCMNGGQPSQQCTQCVQNATMGSGECASEYMACAAN